MIKRQIQTAKGTYTYFGEFVNADIKYVDGKKYVQVKWRVVKHESGVEEAHFATEWVDIKTVKDV